MKKNNEKDNKEPIKVNFFKKVWYSITKLERYPELAAEGLASAVKYLVKLIFMFSIILSLVTVYKYYLGVNKIAQNINDNAPNFKYSENILTVDSNEKIVNDTEEYGKIIVDTNQEDEEQINMYMQEISESGSGILILKNKVILKYYDLEEKVEYTYEDLLGKVGVTEFDKGQLVEYLKSSQMTSIYLNIFMVLILYSFVIYLINTLINILSVSIFGYLAVLIMKMKMRYVAVFNMATYAVTLSTILNIVYVFINIIFNYQINYFDLMYTLVASIYMIASIFIIKTDFLKKQGEVQKIVEIENQIKEEIKQEENNDENKKEDKKENKREKEGDEEIDKGEEPQGSNA